MERGAGILIVEDEAITAMLLKRGLEKAGYSVFKPIATGEAAVEIAKTNHFNLILMDINLADRMDGIEAAESIRRFSDTPIIFMTGYRDDAIVDRAMHTNPAAYLVKPVVLGDLLPIIREHMSS
jgi:CheY-like chemotaxis protein